MSGNNLATVGVGVWGGDLSSVLLQEQITPGAYLSIACNRKGTESIFLSVIFNS